MSTDPEWDDLLRAFHRWEAKKHPDEQFSRLRCYRPDGTIGDELRIPPPPASAAALAPALPSEDRLPKHSPDFREIEWCDRFYDLTPQQAKCMEVLWEAWERGLPAVADRQLLEACLTEATRLVEVFKRNPEAWKNLIHKGRRRGTHCLAFPLRSNFPADADG